MNVVDSARRCSAWGGDNVRHILKSCVEDAASVSDAFSPLSIESDLGISMLQVAHSRLADVLERIQKAAAGELWPAAAALEVVWCLLDGVAAAADISARSFTCSRNAAEALIFFCCRHPPLICQRTQSLIPPLTHYCKLLSERARVALSAAFVRWCDHELSSAVLEFHAMGSEESHMRVLRQAAALNSAVWLHIVSHVAALQRRSPRSLFLTAFALSAAAFDAATISVDQASLRCSSQLPHSASAIQHHRPSLANVCQLQGAKRRALSRDIGDNQASSQGEKGRQSSGGDGPDDAHALRCSYVLSLLRGLHAEISCVRSYIASSGNAFELLPLLHWLLSAEESKVMDGKGCVGLGQLEDMVRAIVDREGLNVGGIQSSPCSLLEAIITVAASDVNGRDNERLVSSALARSCLLVSENERYFD